jgi:hypothetical protein
VRLKRSSPYITVVSEFSATAGGSCGPKLYAKSGGPLTFYWAQTQFTNSAQYEVTSDIGPTTTGSVTRAADVLVYKGDDGNLGGVGSEKMGTIEFDFVCDASVTDYKRLLTLSDGGDTNNRLHIYIYNGRIYALFVDGGVNQVSTAGITFNLKVINRVKIVYSTNFFEFYLNGALEAYDYACTITDDLDKINDGSSWADTQQCNCNIGNLKIYRRKT